MKNSELTIKAVREMGMDLSSKLYKMFESGKCDDMSIDQVSRFAEMIVSVREVRSKESERDESWWFEGEAEDWGYYLTKK